MISKEQLEQIETELNNFDLNEDLIREALDHNESATINEVVAKGSLLVAHVSLITGVAFYCGVWGKVAASAYIISKLADGLKLYANYKAGKKIRQEYERFTQVLKEKGIYDTNKD